jgi:hypothetical protein
MLKRVWLILAAVVVAGVQSQGQVCSTLSASVTQENVDAVRATTVQMVEGASRSLDIAVSSFRDGGICDAVVRAARRGVLVRVILPAAAQNEPGSQYGTLAAASVPLQSVQGSTPFTHRFAVVDGAVVITGSYEWAGGASQAAYGTLTVIRCPSSTTDHSTADEFSGDFAELWGVLSGGQVTQASGTSPASMSITIQEVDLEDQCILLFNRGTSPADIGGWVISDSEGRYMFPQGAELSSGELYRLCIGALNPIDVFLLYLDPDGDEVYLVAPDGTIVDQVVW